jgi:hypothetical protein
MGLRGKRRIGSDGKEEDKERWNYIDLGRIQ